MTDSIVTSQVREMVLSDLDDLYEQAKGSHEEMEKNGLEKFVKDFPAILIAGGFDGMTLAVMVLIERIHELEAQLQLRDTIPVVDEPTSYDSFAQGA